MILGIVLHSANVFSDSDWAIRNTDTSIFFTYLIDAIHSFRMPAFFIVSGFFCHMTLTKSGPKTFINVRLPRIIIPLFVTALTLNILQNIVLTNYGQLEISFLDLNYWLMGKWVSHLWFLNCLIYFFILSALAYITIPGILNKIKISINIALNYSKGFFILLLPIASIILLKLSYIFPNIDEDYYDAAISDSIKYSVYFTFGIILGTNKTLLKDFSSPRLIVILITSIVILLLSILHLNNPFTTKIANSYKESLLVWSSCIACFYIFKRFLNIKTNTFKYLASASYSIYLFHHIFVIIFGLIIIQLNLDIFVKFTLLITSTFLATNIIHYLLISRFQILSKLFNGKNVNE
jgi:glucan biosynthesis protein C